MASYRRNQWQITPEYSVAFGGHYYGRDGQELSPLNLEEIERIRAQNVRSDWSAVIVDGATIDDLDPMGIEGFIK